MLTWLEESPEHEIERDAVIARLQTYFPNQKVEKLFDTLVAFGRYAEVLTDAGVELRTGVLLSRIDADGDGVRVDVAGGDPLQFDRVVCTAAAPLASKLVPGPLNGLPIAHTRPGNCAAFAVSRTQGEFVTG